MLIYEKSFLGGGKQHCPEHSKNRTTARPHKCKTATILEPDGKYYWLGSYHFEGDPLLTEEELSPESPRGGSIGLLHLEMKDGIMTGERDFVLGENVYD